MNLCSGSHGQLFPNDYTFFPACGQRVRGGEVVRLFANREREGRADVTANRAERVEGKKKDGRQPRLPAAERKQDLPAFQQLLLARSTSQACLESAMLFRPNECAPRRDPV